MKISQNLHENNFIKKEILAQVFSCEFSEIFNNNFFYRAPLMATFQDICMIMFLKFMDSSKTQKSKYFERETLFFLSYVFVIYLEFFRAFLES